jgi:acetyltransferase-like isoleucine patch superfamily enzyme
MNRLGFRVPKGAGMRRFGSLFGRLLRVVSGSRLHALHRRDARAVPALPACVTVGHDCAIRPEVRFISDDPIVIGDGVTIWEFTEIYGPVTIGNGTFLNQYVYVRANTRIGKNVNVAQFAKFISDSHEISSSGRRAGTPGFRTIVIEDGVWIGASALILGGVTVGRGSIIGAGSVVTHDVEPNTIYAGNPARLIRELPALE